MKNTSIPTMCLLFLFVTTFGYSQNNCTNVLPNPDFEIGIDNWTITGDAASSNDSYAGSLGAEICDGSGSISKAIACTPGKEYNASLWAKKTNGGTFYSNIQLRFLDENYSPISGVGDSGQPTTDIYTKLDFSAIAPSNAAFVHFYIYKANGVGCIFLDEAELCEADEGNDCNINVSLSPFQCDDNNTPNDPLDDLFSFEVTVTNPGGGAGFESASGLGGLISGGDYGVTYTYGPALISAFGFNPSSALIRDIDNPDCQTSYSIGALSPCSNSTSSCDGNNSLTNGGFENGLSDWTINGATSLSSASSAYAGNAAGQICDGSGSISKAIPTTPGTVHYASLWAGTSNSPNALTYANAELRFLTSSYSPIPGSSDSQNIGLSGYTKLDFTGTAPANAAFVHLYIYKANGGCLYLDEVEMCLNEDPNDCVITVDVDNLQCFDNNTPSNPNDDLFSVDITVNNTGGGSGFIPMSGFGPIIPAGDYGVTYTYGPIPIAEFDLNPSTTYIRDIDNSLCSTAYSIPTPQPCSNGSGGNIDLELAIAQSPQAPDIYSTYEVTLTLHNNSNTTATDVKLLPIRTPFADAVLIGSNPFTASVGTVSTNGRWEIDELGAGATATLVLRFFLLQETPPIHYAQVIAANETDTDSTPNNGNSATITNEDDEASTFETTPPPNTGNDCAFIKTYDNVSGLELDRSFNVTENGDGSLSLSLRDIAPDSRQYLGEVAIDKNGNFESFLPADFYEADAILDQYGYFIRSGVGTSATNTLGFERYDLDKNFIWGNQYVIDFADEAYFNAIYSLQQGGFLIAGNFSINNNQSNSFPFYVRLDEDGNVIWITQSENDYFGPPVEIEITEAKDGGFYVSGRPPGGSGYQFEKLSTNGEVEWFFTRSAAYIRLNNIQESADGNYVFFADERGSNAGQQLNYIWSNLFKYTTSGEEVWTTDLRGFGANLNNSKIISLADGGAAVSYSRIGENGIRYTRLDADGNFIWDKYHPLSKNIILETIDGGLLFSGLTPDNTPYLLKTTAEGDLSPSCNELTPSDQLCTENFAVGDYSCSNLDANGNLIVITTEGSTTNTSTIDANGNIISGPTFGNRLPVVKEYIASFPRNFVRTEDGFFESFQGISSNTFNIFEPSNNVYAAASFGEDIVLIGFKDFNTSTGLLESLFVLRLDSNGNVVDNKTIPAPASHVDITQIQSAQEVSSGTFAFIYANGDQGENQATLYVLDDALSVSSTFDLERPDLNSKGSISPTSCGDYKITAESSGACGANCLSRTNYWGSFTNGQFVVNKVSSFSESSVQFEGTWTRSWSLVKPSGTTYTVHHVQDFNPTSYPVNNAVTIVQAIGGTFFSQTQVEVPRAADIVALEEVNNELVFLQNNEVGGLGLVNVSCLENNAPTGIELPCDVSYTVNNGNLVINGLSAEHIIVKLFGPNWETLYTCLDNCDNPFIMSNLPEGTYHLSINKYNSNWQPECSFLEDLIIINSTNLQGQNNEDFSYEQALDEIVLFPNPVTDRLQLNLVSLFGEEVEISIYNQLGKPVKQLKVDEVAQAPLSFDVSEWNAGMYFINIKTKNQKARTLRFVKVRL